MKKLVKVVLALVALLLLLILALPLWIGPVVTRIANAVGPKYTGTDFSLGEFGLNPYAGRVHVGDVKVANPTNCSEKYAVQLGGLDIAVDLGTLSEKKIVVDSVDLDGLVVYSTTDAGNLRQIGDNLKAATASDGSAAQPAPEPAAGEKEKDEGVRLQINRLTLRNIAIKYGIVTVKLPATIELTDIGTDSEEGVTPLEAAQLIFNKVMESAGDFGESVGKLGKAGGALVDAIKTGDAGALTNIDVDATIEAGKKIKDAFKKDSLKEAGNKLKGMGIENLFK